MGNGIASLNVRVIYLMQNEDSTFSKLSFDDKMDGNRPERDFDGDGIYEVVTMTLNHHDNHNYWTFNIFEFSGSGLINGNEKGNYPIMIQFLHRKNYGMTDKLSRAEMKTYGLELPEEYEGETGAKNP